LRRVLRNKALPEGWRNCSRVPGFIWARWSWP
jgi:hypothetical protein